MDERDPLEKAVARTAVLGSIERAYADGYAAAQKEIERLTGLWKAAEAQEWRDLQEARAKIERLEADQGRLWEILEQIDRIEPETTAWLEKQMRFQLSKRRLGAALAGKEGTYD